IGTVCPSPTLISFSTPAEGDGISASTLSVEISNSGSSRSTLSPGFLSHLVIVPSKILSPIWGITMSTAMIALLFPQNLNTAPILSRQQKLSSRWAGNDLPASARTALAYPARSRAVAARPDRQRPSRTESPRFHPQFLRFSCLHAPRDICWSSSPTAGWFLHPAAAASAGRSLPPRCLPAPAPPRLRATCASSRRKKGWSGVSLRGVSLPFRSARCNLRREFLP